MIIVLIYHYLQFELLTLRCVQSLLFYNINCCQLLLITFSALYWLIVAVNTVIIITIINIIVIVINII